MAKITEQVGIVLGEQSAEGTPNSDVDAATIIANIDDGNPLSAGEALGLLIRDNSLSLDFARVEDKGSDITGSFTKTKGNILRSEASTFSFDFTVKGSCQTTTTPVAGEYDLPEAIKALYAGAGLIKGTSTASNTPYNLGTPVFLTFKIWRHDISFMLQDCRINTLVWKPAPGNIVIGTVNVAPGSITFDNSDTFPTSIDYGIQESVAAPVLKAAAATIGATSRPFLDGTVTVDNQFSQYPDSNATDGIMYEQTGRTISWSGKWYVDSTDETQDWDNLVVATPADEIFFRLGTAAGAATLANALEFTLYNVNLEATKLAQTPRRVIWDLTGYCTHTTSDSEFTLVSV